MSKITQYARGQKCTIRIPHVCNHNPDTTVFCHLSGVRFGHGIGNKVADIFGAFGCSSCHDLVDGRSSNIYKYTKQELKLMHLEGVIETQAILMREGLIKCD